jgi:predicted alpha/beta hydrolase family esterase
MKTTALHWLAHGLVTLVVVAAALAAYDRWVLRPALVIGVVDVAEVYRAKEAEFTEILTKTLSQPHSEDDRQKALAMAKTFAQRLPAALDELPRECGCLVLLKTAVAGPTPNTVDLTAQLRRKVEAP